MGAIKIYVYNLAAGNLTIKRSVSIILISDTIILEKVVAQLMKRFLVFRLFNHSRSAALVT
jgi:hypothetical protein